MRFLFPPRQHAPARPDDSASPDDQLLAAEPVLRSRQRPRLNHKALVFAATLLAGSAAMVAWSMNRLPWSDGGSAPMRSSGERVELPPQGFQASASAATAALLPDTLPPLPPPLPAASQSAPGMTAGSAMPIAMDNSALAPMDTAPVPLAPARASRAALREPISPLSQADGPLVETVNPAAADSGGSAMHVQRVAHPATLLPRGRVIRCVLETRIVSDLAGLTVSLRVDGKTVDSAQADMLLEHPLDVVLWLVEHGGYDLKPGSVISLGSLGSLHPAQAGQRVAAVYRVGGKIMHVDLSLVP